VSWWRAARKAFEAYLAYRREGGYPRTPGAELTQSVLQAIQAGATDEAAQGLAQLHANPELPTHLQGLVPVLQAIVAGSRDSQLAQDPALDYDDAAEVTLLLEQLGNA
jgi:hypothetical protein